ncbi:MAG: hypothetical protein ACK52L_05815, partial [Pirellula sp.]
MKPLYIYPICRSRVSTKFLEFSFTNEKQGEKLGPSGFTVDLVKSATKEIVDAGQRVISADTWVSFSMDSGVCEAGCR